MKFIMVKHRIAAIVVNFQFMVDLVCVFLGHIYHFDKNLVNYHDPKEVVAS